MLSTSVFYALYLLAILQAPPPQPTPTVSASRFVGTWVGVQSWAIEKAPPGALENQPVTLTLEMVDGKLVGTMLPFMGGQDGATIVESKIVGEELQASAVVGRPRPAAAGGAARGTTTQGAPGATAAGRGRGGRGGTPPPSWKDPITVNFSFRNDGLNVTGTADVLMGDVRWLKFDYALSKKRSRY